MQKSGTYVELEDGNAVISIATVASSTDYSESRIKQLINNGVLPSFAFKGNRYILLPPAPCGKFKDPVPYTFLGKKRLIYWYTRIIRMPPAIRAFFCQQPFSKTNTPISVTTNTGSKVIPNEKVLSLQKNIAIKKPSPDTGNITSNWNISLYIPTGSNQMLYGSNYKFNSTVEYKYGHYLIYKDGIRMSTFLNGGGDLASTNIVSAMFEIARLLDSKEKAKNGATPGGVQTQNIGWVVDSNTGLINITATLPHTVSLVAGLPRIDLVDYLGVSYSTYDPGTAGDTVTTNLPDAFMEVATRLAAAEKLATPQPNNIQIVHDTENLQSVVNCTLPFTTSADATGNVTITPVDYL